MVVFPTLWLRSARIRDLTPCLSWDRQQEHFGDKNRWTGLQRQTVHSPRRKKAKRQDATPGLLLALQVIWGSSQYHFDAGIQLRCDFIGSPIPGNIDKPAQNVTVEWIEVAAEVWGYGFG